MISLWDRYPLVDNEMRPRLGRIVVFSFLVGVWTVICIFALSAVSLIPALTNAESYLGYLLLTLLTISIALVGGVIGSLKAYRGKRTRTR